MADIHKQDRENLRRKHTKELDFVVQATLEKIVQATRERPEFPDNIIGVEIKRGAVIGFGSKVKSDDIYRLNPDKFEGLKWVSDFCLAQSHPLFYTQFWGEVDDD